MSTNGSSSFQDQIDRIMEVRAELVDRRDEVDLAIESLDDSIAQLRGVHEQGDPRPTVSELETGTMKPEDDNGLGSPNPKITTPAKHPAPIQGGESEEPVPAELSKLALQILDTARGRTVRVSDLHKTLDATMPHIHEALDALYQQGLVNKKHSWWEVVA